MNRSKSSMLCHGAVAALMACAEPVIAAEPPAAASLPQWVLRAQERLVLDPSQQRELRLLADQNSERLRQLQARHASDDSAQGRRRMRAAFAQLQREFRRELGDILTADQLAEWDALLEDLLGEVHLRNEPPLADGTH